MAGTFGNKEGKEMIPGTQQDLKPEHFVDSSPINWIIVK